MTEELFFSNHDNTIVVSNARILLNGISYSTMNVTSVGIRQTKRYPQLKGSVILVLILIGIGAYFFDKGGHIYGPIVCLAGLIATYFALQTSFVIVLTSSSGETYALKSDDRDTVSVIVDAINQAIVSQKTVGSLSADIPQDSHDTKECPQCAETVKLKAKICRFCGYNFN